MDPIVVPCPDCAALNRLPAERVGDGPVCSSCKAPLFAHPVTLDEASFDRVLAKTSLPIVVDFWAAWCGPCRMLAPVLQELADAHAGALKVVKVDTEREPALAARYGIQSLPTLVLLRDGREADRILGALPRQALERRLGLGSAARR